MKKLSLFIISILFIQLSFSQLNAKTKTNQDGGKTTTCFHKNGQTSTIVTWDKEHREGNITGYNNEGKELFHYGLRSYAGHASVYLDYYTNGQVKRAEYSEMPDGGIQWYKYIHEFDEAGTQTNYMDLSMPNGYPELTTFVPDTASLRQKQKVEIIKPEIIECSTPYITEFVLVNETKKTVRITMKARYNQYIQFSDTVVTLKPKQSILFNSTMMAQIFLPETCFEPTSLTNKQKKEKYTFLFTKPTEAKNTRTYVWHVIAK